MNGQKLQEGILGLARAFMLAGAASVVCTLWEVRSERGARERWGVCMDECMNIYMGEGRITEIALAAILHDIYIYI